MSNKHRKKIYPMVKYKKFITFFISIIILIIAVVLSNPLRWSEESIERYVLNKTPINSSFDEVRLVINNHKWKISDSSQTHGFYDQRFRPAKITGDMYIRASLGDYQGIPFEANVTIYWGFGKDGKLIDVWIWKTWDAL